MEQLQLRDREIEHSGVFDSPKNLQDAQKGVNKRKSVVLNKHSKFYQFNDIDEQRKKGLAQNLSTRAQKGSKAGTPTRSRQKKSKQSDIFDFDFKTSPNLLKKNKSSANLQKKTKTTLFGGKREEPVQSGDLFQTSNEAGKRADLSRPEPRRIKNFSMVNFQRRSEMQANPPNLFDDFFSNVKHADASQLSHRRNKSTIHPATSNLLDLDFNGDKANEGATRNNKYDFLDDISNGQPPVSLARKGASPTDQHLQFI